MANNGTDKDKESGDFAPPAPVRARNQGNGNNRFPIIVAQIPYRIRPAVLMGPGQPLAPQQIPNMNYPRGPTEHVQRQPFFPPMTQNMGQQQFLMQFGQNGNPPVLRELLPQVGPAHSFLPQHQHYPMSCHISNCQRCRAVLARRNIGNQRPYEPLVNRNIGLQHIPEISGRIRNQRNVTRQAPYASTTVHYSSAFSPIMSTSIQPPIRPVRSVPPQVIRDDVPNILGLVIIHLLLMTMVIQVRGN